MTRLIDLSMPVHRDMLTFPRVPPPTLLLYESWTEFAERIGAAQYGVKSLTASYLVITNDHVGTHLDAVHHIVPSAGGPETIPLDYCYSDGVVLDFTDKPKGYGITAADIDAAAAKAGCTIKEKDIGYRDFYRSQYERRLATSSPAASICCCSPTTCSSAARNSTASRPWVTRTIPIMKAPRGRRLMRRTKGRQS